MKTVNELLKEQMILDFEKKGLGELIVYFMASYPNYSYEEFPIDGLSLEYLSYYDIPFLASYIRYSDISLLGSGMRDNTVKEKLCFLHTLFGTIHKEYRKFIWSDFITLDDLKRWSPLLCKYRMKDRILKCSKITEELKNFLNECTDMNSYAFKNLEMLNSFYPNGTIELSEIASLDQFTFYKLLQMIKDSNESVPFYDLINCFYKLNGVLKSVSLEELGEDWFLIREYLREPLSYRPIIEDRNDFKKFRENREKAHIDFLENEYDMKKLKNFFSQLFLGLDYEVLEATFTKIKPSLEPKYILLERLVQARFPLMLKQGLYQDFKKQGDFHSYLNRFSLKSNAVFCLEVERSLDGIHQNNSVFAMKNNKFTFLTLGLEDYQKVQNQDIVKAEIRTEDSFDYKKNSSLLAFSFSNIVSVDSKTCLLKGKGLNPCAIVVFDMVTFEDLSIRKHMNLPIILIDTEYYAKKSMRELDELFAEQNFEKYIEKKTNLFVSLKEHPWLFQRYFGPECLYQDLEIWMKHLEECQSLDCLKYSAHISNLLKELDQNLESSSVEKVKELNRR